MSACMRWFCYDDPYDCQCAKIVRKGNTYVRCRRSGIYYDKKSNKYYCEMHYKKDESIEKRPPSFDSCSSVSTD